MPNKRDEMWVTKQQLDDPDTCPCGLCDEYREAHRVQHEEIKINSDDPFGFKEFREQLTN